MHDEMLLYGALGVLVLGAVVTAGYGRWRRLCGWVAFAFVAIASVLLAALALQVLIVGPLEGAPPLLEVMGIRASLQFHVDALSAFFLLILAGLGTLASLYSIDYLLHPHYDSENLLRYYPFLLLFLAGMVGVLCVWDWLFFLAFWELMTLASYVLVVFERANPVNLRAGLKYFIMTHVATGCLLLGVILLGRVGGVGFGETQTAMAWLAAQAPVQLHLVLLLFFVGFATKAAIFPFGDWLPDAHPAAPSAVSALLSGIMIKMGVYGVLRVFGWMMPLSSALTGWGDLIALFGTVSLFLCTLAALLQRDTKRLLAFSSMGQMGYIFLGLGVGLAFLRVAPAVSALGFLGALYHVLNHACFKGLLFLNAGAIFHRTGTRDLDQLGGVARWMGWTTLAALIAALAISGVPPLNGFGSKWLLYQASLAGGLQVPLYLVLGIVALFTSALTLAYFMKFFATVFLAPASHGVEALQVKQEVPGTMRWSQMILALACVGLGLAAMPVLAMAYAALTAMRPTAFPALTAVLGSSAWILHPNPGTGISGAWNPVGLLLALVVGAGVPIGLLRLAGVRRRVVEPWLCGEAHDLEEVRVGAESFYRPFREVMSFAVGNRRIPITYPALPPPHARWLASLPRWLNFDVFYEGALRVGARWCERFSQSHTGVPQLYVLWMAAGAALAVAVLFLLS